MPGTLSGTPYGTSPAWGNLPNTYDKVFDSDLSTFFDFAEPDDGYAGIDLGGGGASAVGNVYYAALPLDPSKTVRFVTLPANLNLHVFALAIGGS